MMKQATNHTTGQNRAGDTRVFATKLNQQVRMYPSGLMVDPMDISPDDITIEEIACLLLTMALTMWRMNKDYNDPRKQ